MFDPDKGIANSASSDDLVEFDLYGCAIAVLRVLDKENHEKGDYGRAGIDHELPCVRKMKQWTGDCPYQNDRACKCKGGGPTSVSGGTVCDLGEPVRSSFPSVLVAVLHNQGRQFGAPSQALRLWMISSGLGRFGVNIDFRLCNFAERGVGILFFQQSFIEQFDSILVTQFGRPALQGAIA